ncbi:RND family efflux transporter, MFP subunit [Rhizobium sp. RU20A]|uniref:efflux RND transporter periplasmic adaptor subunit n=1 Tax=Rhizobium sp. RU20A TaxID=1907412 RepID=UPI0009546944|nr:efflux RND transporter periplasmic adaptor subunit [Rhizobium sp. RU20A]SIQ19910.1 RND family efflux transporter, MFP subunit [Rhizobium sp. RU20A]
MRLWQQVVVSVVVIGAGVVAWGRMAPGAGDVLRGAGLPEGIVAVIAPAPATGPEGQAQSGNRQRGGGPTLVVTRPVGSAVINDRLNAIGNGEAIRSVTVTPSATGNLTDILVKSGDVVEAGQVIAKLDSADQTIAARQARVALDSAREKVERFRRNASAFAVQDLRDAETTLQGAELTLQAAELDLKRRDITAPTGGIVGIITVNVGDYVTTSSPIANIDDRSEILVDYWVPERFATKVKVGQPVTAEAVAQPGTPLKGVVHAIDNRIDQASRTLRVRARIDNADDRLRAGMSFAVTMAFDGDRYPTVDPLAVQWSGDGSFVWRVAAEKSERVPVKIVQRNPDKVLVDATLADGDPVVTEGLQRLRDGGAVSMAGQQRGDAETPKVSADRTSESDATTRTAKAEGTR